MKIKSEIYAKALIDSLNDGKPVSEIAKHFWYLLQKNNQYKNLSEILALIDLEYAKKHNLVLAEVASGTVLSDTQKQTIKTRLTTRFGRDVLVRNVIRPKIGAGIIVKAGDREIDLSLNGKIDKLKTILVK